jgi:hypothetical protein
MLIHIVIIFLFIYFVFNNFNFSNMSIFMKFREKYPNKTAKQIMQVHGHPDLIEKDKNGYLTKLTWHNIEGCDGVIVKGDIKYKWHPIPAITYVFAYNYMFVPEKLVGPLKYASETINVDYIDVPEKESKHYYKTGEKLLGKVSGACASITISVITIKFVEDMIQEYSNSRYDSDYLSNIFRNEYDKRILNFLCGKGIVPEIPWYPNKVEGSMIKGPYDGKKLPDKCLSNNSTPNFYM